MKEETRKLLDKAERALNAAETLMRESDAEFASGRAYYAMLYTAQALLREKDCNIANTPECIALSGNISLKRASWTQNFTDGCWMLSTRGFEVTMISNPPWTPKPP